MYKTFAAARRRFILTLTLAMLASLATGLQPAVSWARTAPEPRVTMTTANHATELARRHVVRCAGHAEAFARIELFFGLSRPGGVITEQDFKSFVDASVTPRFPDGLSLLTGNGQFRDAGGTIVSEGSKLLILLVPVRDAQADTKVEAIRSDYRRQFQQESVLRADAASCVSF